MFLEFERFQIFKDSLAFLRAEWQFDFSSADTFADTKRKTVARIKGETFTAKILN